jgi:hypothetical protein
MAQDGPPGVVAASAPLETPFGWRSGTLRKRRGPGGRQPHALVDLPSTLEFSAAKLFDGNFEVDAEDISWQVGPTLGGRRSA